MVEALPEAPYFEVKLNPGLKAEKDFLHSLDKCHPLALQQDKARIIRVQMCDDLLSKVNLGERSVQRRNVGTKYAESVRKIEGERRAYIEDFKALYPNSDKMEAQITQDMEKIKKVDDKYKEVSALFSKLNITPDLNARGQLTTKYQEALQLYKNEYDKTTSEFKKGYLERMESTIVSDYELKNSYYFSIG